MAFDISDVAARSLDRLLAERVASGAVPGVVAVAGDRHGSRYAGAAGLAHAEVPMAVDAVFRIASMTKPLTSAAIMILVEDGRLGLDQPLADYLPGYAQPELLDQFDWQTGSYSTRAAANEITLRQLLTHTSGYGYWFLDRRLMMLTDGAPELFNAPFLVSRPGEKFVYGTSTDVLGQVIEPVTGMSLDTFLQRELFEPLGMTDTSFRMPRDQTRLVSVFARSGEAWVEQQNETSGPAPRGGGGLYSTAADYLSFLRMLLNDGVHDGVRILQAESVRALTRNQIGELFAEQQRTAFMARSNDFIFMDGTQKFGFGVAVESRDQPFGRRAGSYGWAGILNTYFWADPASDLAAIVLMQVQPFADADCVACYRAFETALYGQVRA